MKPADHLSYFSEHPQIKKNKDIVVKPTASDLFAHVEQWAIAKGLDNQNNRNAQALKVMEEVGETMAALARGKKEPSRMASVTQLSRSSSWQCSAGSPQLSALTPHTTRLRTARARLSTACSLKSNISKRL
jgi:hypothetical protein